MVYNPGVGRRLLIKDFISKGRKAAFQKTIINLLIKMYKLKMKVLLKLRIKS